MSKPFTIGVLISGRGSNLMAIGDAIAQGECAATIGVVISNKADAGGLEYAGKSGFDTAVVSAGPTIPREQSDQNIVDILKEKQVDLVVLAGYMRLISDVLLNAFPQKIINIHPSLLPAFKGLHAPRQAVEYGVKYSGCTVHFVDEGCDSGPILLQAAVPVEPDDTEDTLAARILKQEHKILPKAIDLLAKNKVKVVDRQVLIV